jgi:hypothetical protein
MSLGIAIKGPEGLVLAAESRVTITVTQPDGRQTRATLDNATKLLSFRSPNNGIGATTYGQAAIGRRPVHSFVPEFEAALPDDRLDVLHFSERLATFFLKQWEATMPADYNGPGMTFIVGGFDSGEPYGRLFLFDIPRRPTPIEHHPGTGSFGITWGGDSDIVFRLIKGFDHRLPEIAQRTLQLSPSQRQALDQALSRLHVNFPIDVYALQDCVDLAILLIRSTIAVQALALDNRGCGDRSTSRRSRETTVSGSFNGRRSSGSGGCSAAPKGKRFVTCSDLNA